MLITTKSAEAAQRPFAGSGIGAHLCDGLVDAALVGMSGPEVGAPIGIETAAVLALPRVKWAAAISGGSASAGASDAGYQASIRTESAQFKPEQSKAQQHTTRVNPAFQGGVGPHPAREPEPV